MGIARTVIVCLCAILLVSCGGGPRVATPSDDADIPRLDNKLTNADKNYLQDLKTKNPEDYDLLYELSKDDDDLMIDFIDSESKREDITTEYRGEDGKTLGNIEEFLTVYSVDVNPSDATREFYGYIKSNEFEKAFAMLHPDGLEKQKYKDNINAFVSSWRGMSNGMRYKDVNVYGLSTYRVGDAPAVEAVYSIWGFFAPTDIQKDAPGSTFMPPTGMDETEGEKKESDAISLWDYRESGKASMILMPHQGKWLIYALP